MYQLPEPEPTSEQELRKRGQAVFWEYVREVGKNYLFSHGLDFDEAYDAAIYPNYEIELDKETDLGVDDEGMEI